MTERKSGCTYKDGKKKEDYKKHYNHNLPTFAKTMPPTEIKRSTTRPKPMKSSIDHIRFKLAKWNNAIIDRNASMPGQPGGTGTIFNIPVHHRQ